MTRSTNLNRLRILTILTDYPDGLTFGEFLDKVEFTRGPLNNHLRKLIKDEMLVVAIRKKDGKRVYMRSAKAMAESEFFDIELFAFLASESFVHDTGRPFATSVEEQERYNRKRRKELIPFYKKVLEFCAMRGLVTGIPWLRSLPMLNEHLVEQVPLANTISLAARPDNPSEHTQPTIWDKPMNHTRFAKFNQLVDKIKKLSFPDKTAWAKTLQIKRNYESPAELYEKLMTNNLNLIEYTRQCLHHEFNYYLDNGVDPVRLHIRLWNLEDDPEAIDTILNWFDGDIRARWERGRERLTLPP